MFGKLQSKPVTEIAPTIAAPALLPEVPDLEGRRAAIQGEVDSLQARVDETDAVVRDLQTQVSKEARMGHALHCSDPRAIALREARDHFQELLLARNEKAAELDATMKKIRNQKCEPLMLELHGHVREAAALFAQALGPNARAHACVQQLQELGAEIPEVFIRGLSIATVAPTDYSKFCDACDQVGIEIERPAHDTPSIPPPASFYFRQHDDASYAMRLGANAAGGGFGPGFREGYMTRARNF